jgi:cobalamin biosynthesis protein CobT
MDLSDKVQSELTQQEPQEQQEQTQGQETAQPENDTQAEQPEEQSEAQTQAEEEQETQEQQTQEQQTKGYWYEQIPPHEFQRIKAKYWEQTVPIVAKEVGMSETELVKMMLAVGIDSPDLITDLRKTIAEIDSKNKRVTEDNKAIKPQKATPKEDIGATIRNKSWYEIAEIIKKQRGVA